MAWRSSISCPTDTTNWDMNGEPMVLGMPSWIFSIHITGRRNSVTGLKEGVEVQHFMSDGYDQLGYEWRADGAGNALLDFLHSYNWQAKFGYRLKGGRGGPAFHVRRIRPIGI